MIDVRPLNPVEYAGHAFTFHYETNGYYAIERTERGFHIAYQAFPETKQKSFTDSFFADWLDHPVAFGAFDGDKLIGFAEGALERWNNRFRISNIGIFDDSFRHQGIGTRLMDTILAEAIRSGARMVILETQTCNERAISFYHKQGFKIIGFDLFSYSNEDPERHEVRIEMGKCLL